MNTPSDDQIVDLNEFANMAGFPIELIRKELVLEEDTDAKVTMAELRAAMLKYLDQATLN